MELTADESRIISYYGLFDTYAETSRHTGLSLAVVKRVVDGNFELTKKRKNCFLVGLKANPDFGLPQGSTKDFSTQVEELLDEVMLNGCVL